jgi:hypothetical protein
MPNITLLCGHYLKKLIFEGYFSFFSLFDIPPSPASPLPPSPSSLTSRNYNTMVLDAPGAKKVEMRSETVKEEMLHTTLSRSY